MYCGVSVTRFEADEVLFVSANPPATTPNKTRLSRTNFFIGTRIPRAQKPKRKRLENAAARLRGTHCGRLGGENQTSRAQCRVKSGTPVAKRDEEEMEGMEICCRAAAGNVQATNVSVKADSSFCVLARTGAAGAGAEPGEVGVTQQFTLPQSQHLHAERVPAFVGGWATRTACVPISRRLSKMADSLFMAQTIADNWGTRSFYLANPRLFLGLARLGFVELFEILLWVFVEILEAGLAAKLDFSALVFEDVGFAHLAEFLVGHDTLVERVRFGLFILLLFGEGGEWRGQIRNGQCQCGECFQFFHDVLSLTTTIKRLAGQNHSKILQPAGKLLAQLLPGAIKPHLHGLGRTIEHRGDFRVRLLLVFDEDEREGQFLREFGDGLAAGGWAAG